MPRPAPSSEILVPSQHRLEVDPAEIAAAAARLGTRFPAGYESFLTTYGEGTLSSWVQIWAPSMIEEHTQFLHGLFRDQIAEGSWFWDRNGVLPPDRAAESVAIAHTLNGDDLVFHPDDPDQLYALPRHRDKIHRAGRGLDEALDWLFLSGKLTRKIPRRVFIPHTKRRKESWSVELPYRTIRRRLLALGIHEEVTEDDSRQRNLELLVRDIGGEISLHGPERSMYFIVVSKTVNGVPVPVDEPESSDVYLDCDPDAWSPGLEAFLTLMAEIAGEPEECGEDEDEDDE